VKYTIDDLKGIVKKYRAKIKESEQHEGNTESQDKDLSEQYARARSDMIDKIADDIIKIADEEMIPTGEGKVDNAMVQKQRLRVDTRKWLLSKLAPKKYGDKLELTGDDKSPLTIQRIERVIVKQ
jgi:hypothetical protein